MSNIVERWRASEVEETRSYYIEEMTDELKSHASMYWNVRDVSSLDFRIRFHDGFMYLHVGHSSFDTDHRGFIGASTIDIDDEREAIKESVRFAFEQLDEAHAQATA